MEIGIKLVKDSIFTTYIWPIVTTLIGVVAGGFITLKANAYHEKKKLIMERKLKIWESVCTHFKELDNKIPDIKNCIPRLLRRDENKEYIVVRIREQLPDLLIFINKIERELKDYYIILEKIEYVSNLKNKFYDLKICVKDNDFDLNKFNDTLDEFKCELFELRENLSHELIRDLWERKTNKKRMNYCRILKWRIITEQIRNWFKSFT